MADDTSTVSYKCPFCGVTKPSEKRVRQHIDSKKTGGHSGHSYDTDVTIETIYEGEGLYKRNKSKHSTIKKAGEKVLEGELDEVDELDNDGIREIADAADTHHSHVMRVFEEEDIEYSYWGNNPPLRKEELSENSELVLKEWVKLGKPDISGNTPGEHNSLSDFKEREGISWRVIHDSINKYGWITEYEDFTNGESGEVEFEGVDEALSDYTNKEEDKGGKTLEEEMRDMEKAKAKYEKETMSDIEKLGNAGVEFTIVVEDKSFEAVKKLLEEGYEELAEKVHDGEY